MSPGVPFLHVPRCPDCDGTGFDVASYEDVNCRACGGSGIAKREDAEAMLKNMIEGVRRDHVTNSVWQAYEAYQREFFPEGYKPTDFLDFVCVALKDEFGFDDPNEVYEHRLKERKK